MTLSLWLDIAISGLLIATIFYAVRLNKKLLIIHENREELQKVLNEFADALERAEKGIAILQGTAGGVTSDLEKSIKTGQALKDELCFLSERGNDLAGRLEGHIRQARSSLQPSRPKTEAPKLRSPRKDEDDQEESKGFRHELIKALGNLR